VKKEEIENRDQALIKKFRTIIQNKENKSTPRKVFFGMALLFIVLTISCILIMQQQPAIHASKEVKTPGQAQKAIAPAEQSTSNISIEKAKAPSGTTNTVPPAPTSSDLVLDNRVLEQKPPVKFIPQRLKKDIPLKIQIEEIISCSNVKNRQYSKPKVKFSLAQGISPKVWMKVISQNPPYKLTHVYYLNEKKYCEVPLAIRYHRMRTWSSITLRSADHVGKWRVDVIDDTGSKLDQIEFAVVK